MFIWLLFISNLMVCFQLFSVETHKWTQELPDTSQLTSLLCSIEFTRSVRLFASNFPFHFQLSMNCFTISWDAFQWARERGGNEWNESSWKFNLLSPLEFFACFSFIFSLWWRIVLVSFVGKKVRTFPLFKRGLERVENRERRNLSVEDVLNRGKRVSWNLIIG